MGLKAIKEALPAQEKRENVKVDLSTFTGNEGDTLTFREPKVSDLIPSSKALEKLRINRAAISSEETAILCLRLSRCHVPEEAGDISTPEDFADIAIKSPQVFIHIAGAFGKAFPMDIAEEAESLKNDGRPEAP